MTGKDWTKALDLYQRSRITRTARIVLSGREMGRLYHAKGVERLVRNSLWKGPQRRALRRHGMAVRLERRQLPDPGLITPTARPHTRNSPMQDHGRFDTLGRLEDLPQDYRDRQPTTWSPVAQPACRIAAGQRQERFGGLWKVRRYPFFCTMHVFSTNAEPGVIRRNGRRCCRSRGDSTR